MRIQTMAETIGKYGCLAFCYLYCSGMYASDSSAILDVMNAMDKGFLDNECTVLSARNLIRFWSGHSYDVTKKDITSIEDIKERTPVRYDYNGHSHWVVVENGSICFNSLDSSQCVAKGKPTTARIIKYR